jgi:ribosomal protein L37AE/L43A
VIRVLAGVAWIKQVSQVGRSRIVVPTCKPELAEMRRIQVTIRRCSNCRSIIYACADRDREAP